MRHFVFRTGFDSREGSGSLMLMAGFALAGHMLEQVTGTAWEDLLTDRLFRPLGMTSAGFGVPATPRYLDEPWGHQLYSAIWMAPAREFAVIAVSNIASTGGTNPGVNATTQVVTRMITEFLGNGRGRPVDGDVASPYPTVHAPHDKPSC